MAVAWLQLRARDRAAGSMLMAIQTPRRPTLAVSGARTQSFAPCPAPTLHSIHSLRPRLICFDCVLISGSAADEALNRATAYFIIDESSQAYFIFNLDKSNPNAPGANTDASGGVQAHLNFSHYPPGAAYPALVQLDDPVRMPWRCSNRRTEQLSSTCTAHLHLSPDC